MTGEGPPLIDPRELMDEEASKHVQGFMQRFVPMRIQMNTLPNGREKSIAVTKLEEAEMWALRAIHVDALIRMQQGKRAKPSVTPVPTEKPPEV